MRRTTRIFATAVTTVLMALAVIPAAQARPLGEPGNRCVVHPSAVGRATASTRIRDDVHRLGRPELTRYLNRNPQLKLQAERAARVATITVPVAFHVIRKDLTVGGGNIPRSWIDDQIEVLNDSFSGATGGDRTGFQFSLKVVTRTTSAKWFRLNGSNKDIGVKTALKVGGTETLNIYSANLGNLLLGYAYLAEDADEVGVLDGVVVNFKALPGGPWGVYSEGDTATHEVGHWFNLEHTFQGGCTGPGDFVDDTAPEASPAFGCPVGRDTCTGDGVDPITNFMDYTEDPCMFEFTSGQGARMQAAWSAYRAP